MKDNDPIRTRNIIEDIKRIQVPKIGRLEDKVKNSKTVAWTGVTLGVVGIGLGAFCIWALYDRGWW